MSLPPTAIPSHYCPKIVNDIQNVEQFWDLEFGIWNAVPYELGKFCICSASLPEHRVQSSGRLLVFLYLWLGFGRQRLAQKLTP